MAFPGSIYGYVSPIGETELGTATTGVLGVATILPNGWYFLPHPAGSFTLTVEADGFITHSEPVTVGSMEYVRLDVTLLPEVPEVVTCTNPGTTADTTPTLRWTLSDRATWYKVCIWDNNNNEVRNIWYTAAECYESDTICAKIMNSLPTGTYKWWVKAWNESGGVWSAEKSMTIT